MKKETEELLMLIVRSVLFVFWFLKELILLVGKGLLLILFETIFRIQDDMEGALELRRVRFKEKREFKTRIKDYWKNT